MYKENLHTKEQKFGNVKIAHFGLFLPLFGTQKNVNGGNEQERSRASPFG